MKFQIFAIAIAVITLIAMYVLIRRGWLKEKYTLIWLLTAIITLALAIFPPILDAFADLLGVQQGPNLLFLVADLAIMLICVQLSIEASTQTYRSRTLAEEVAILRLEVERQGRALDALIDAPPHERSARLRDNVLAATPEVAGPMHGADQ